MAFGALLLVSAAHAESDQCKVNGNGSQQLRTCLEAHCKAKSGCNNGAANARKQSDAAAGQVGQKYGKQTSTSEPAKAIAGVERGSSALYQKAIDDCDALFKNECQQKCKPGQAKAEDKTRITDELKKCDEAIKETKQTLNTAKDGVDKAEKGSEETGKESGGKGEAPKPEEKKDDDKKSDDKATPPTTASTPAVSDAGSSAQAAPAPLKPGEVASTASASGGSCTTEAEATQTQCQDKIKMSCAGSTSTICTQFTNRYCDSKGAAGGGGGPDDIKAGSGLSDPYCKNVTAQSFCTGGVRDTCDSCRALKNLSPLPPEQQDSSCGIDPASLPSLQRNGSNAMLPASTGGGGGGGGSSGGGSGGGSSGVAGKTETKAVTESMYDKLKSAMSFQTGESGGGGGGGGGSGGGDAGGDHTVADFLAGYNVIGKAPASARGPQSADEAMTTAATDIQPRGAGPNVFNIVTEVIGARCAADKQNNCPPRK